MMDWTMLEPKHNITVDEYIEKHNNQDHKLRHEVTTKGEYIGKKWDSSYYEYIHMYKYNGKIYKIENFCGIIGVDET